jgi:hypothetical protein
MQPARKISLIALSHNAAGNLPSRLITAAPLGLALSGETPTGGCEEGAGTRPSEVKAGHF